MAGSTISGVAGDAEFRDAGGGGALTIHGPCTSFHDDPPHGAAFHAGPYGDERPGFPVR